jgi:hypothetical protein
MDTTHNKGNDMSDKITLQKIFDLAWQAFIIEDKPPSFIVGSGCKYDDGKGNRCAVGLALPEHFDFLYNGVFANLINKWPDMFHESVFDNEATKLNNFQKRLHDILVNPYDGSWRYSNKERMEYYLLLAEDYNLTIPAARPTQTTDH